MPNVYYSHSPFGTGDLKVACNLTISSGVATLTAAQTGNIGIGDRVTYDTSKVAYISQVNSSTSLVLITATGGTPSDEASPVTVNSIGHEYASCSAAAGGCTDASHLNTTDFVSGSYILGLPGYYDHDDDTLDTTEFGMPSVTTSSTYRINIYTPQGGNESINNQRHDGKITANRHRFDLGGNHGISLSSSHVSLTGIQIEWNETGGTYYGAIRCNSGTAGGAADHQLDDIVIDGNGSRGFCVFVDTVGTSSVIRLRQVIGYSLGIGSSRALFRCDDVDATMNLYHCVGRDSVYGFKEDNGTMNLYGCVMFDCNDDFFSVSGATDNIACDDAEADVSPSGGNWANEFPNYATGDFEIDPDGNLFEASPITNADDSNVPTVDIAGNDRETSAGTNTTIGAFANGEVTASGATADGAITIGAITISSSAKLGRKASSSIVIGSLTYSSSVKLGRKASASISIGAVTVTSQISLGKILTADISTSPVLINSSAKLGRKASASISISAISINSTVSFVRSASADITISPINIVSNATLINIKTANADLTLSPITIGSSIKLGRPMSSSISLSPIQISSTITAYKKTDASITIGAITISSAVSLIRKLNANITLAAIQVAATATAKKTADSDIILSPLVISSNVSLGRKSSANINFSPITVSSSSKLGRKASASISLGAITVVSIATRLSDFTSYEKKSGSINSILNLNTGNKVKVVAKLISGTSVRTAEETVRFKIRKKT